MAQKIINETDSFGYTPLAYVSKYHLNILRIMQIKTRFYFQQSPFFYFLKFQAVFDNSHESAKTLIAENAIIDEKTKEECQSKGDTETKTIISNEILKRVSKRLNYC